MRCACIVFGALNLQKISHTYCSFPFFFTIFLGQLNTREFNGCWPSVQLGRLGKLAG